MSMNNLDEIETNSYLVLQELYVEEMFIYVYSLFLIKYIVIRKNRNYDKNIIITFVFLIIFKNYNN